MKKILIITLMATLILLSEKVSASSYVSNWIPSAQYKVIGGQYANATADNGAYYYFNGNLNATSTTYFYKFGRQFTLPSDGKEMLFNIKINLTQPNGIELYENQYICNATNEYHELGPADPYETDYEYSLNKLTCTAHYTTGDISETKYSVTMLYWADNVENSQHPCYVKAQVGQTYTFACPIDIFNINGLVVKIWSNTYSAFNFGLNDMFSIEKDMSGTINNSINSQTQQQQNNFNEIMNETQQYNDQTNTNINGANETIEYEQAESQLIESLDVNESIMDNISINPQASAFIWNIADQLRNMNPSIIILMTSILGIGIFKLILNR